MAQLSIGVYTNGLGKGRVFTEKLSEVDWRDIRSTVGKMVPTVCGCVCRTRVCI